MLVQIYLDMLYIGFNGGLQAAKPCKKSDFQLLMQLTTSKTMNKHIVVVVTSNATIKTSMRNLPTCSLN